MNDHWNSNANGDDSTILDIFEDVIKSQNDIQIPQNP